MGDDRSPWAAPWAVEYDPVGVDVGKAAVESSAPAADAGLAAECAADAVAAFERYNAEFRAVTRRAPARFAERDWQGSQRDAIERIDSLADVGELARASAKT